jgi:hypothetical protein
MNELVFVSAQPDIPYFHWQTKIYIHNFIDKGVKPNQIHVLFVILNGSEPSEESLKLKSIGVNVHHYEDTRIDTTYIPTLRPLILSKWLKENPELGKCYFYHDSDIIFRELPDFDSLLNDDFSYLSNTISYIGYDYIKECSKRYEDVHIQLYEGELIDRMCGVIGISPDVVKENQLNSGGAQYLIKNTDYLFWEKVFNDSERLYKMLFNFHKIHPINHEIQMWTSDMWAVLWNLWLIGNETRVSNKLSFSWATDSIEQYETHPILHMAGVTYDLRETKFYKGEFINRNPLELLNEDETFFDYVDNNSATKKYVEVMKSMIKNQKMDYLL